jgi:hypothetical protein
MVVERLFDGLAVIFPRPAPFLLGVATRRSSDGPHMRHLVSGVITTLI